MANRAEQNIEKCKAWLTKDVYPLWSQKGIDKANGGFVESLTFEGEPMDVPRRAMVQSRQIYSFLTGSRLGCVSREVAHQAALSGTRYMIKNFAQL